MRVFSIFLCLVVCQLSIADDSIFTPFREGRSNYVKASEVQSATKYFKANKEAVLNDTAELLQNADPNFDTLILEFDSALTKYVKKSSQKRTSLIHLINLMRSEELIDDVLHRLLNDQIEKTYPTDTEVENEFVNPGPAISMKEYLGKKAALIKAFAKMAKIKDETVSRDQANPFPIKEFSMSAAKYKKISARERLYYLYTTSQIKEMASIIDLALNVSDAKSVVTTINFRDQNKAPLIIEHSPTDQYRLAVRLMKAEKKDAENDVLRLGRRVSNLDLIASAYELGILSYEELSLVVHDKNFYLPEVPMIKKVGKYVGELALLGLRVNPVTAPYVLVPLILYNTYVESKKGAKQIDEDSFMFTLPETK